MNLVAKCASGIAKPLISKVTSFVKHLRTHHADSAELKNAKMPRAPLPVDTRWNSVFDCLEYFTTHWSNISLIFEKTLGPQDTLYRFMEQIQIKRSSQDLNLLQLVGIALGKLQSDGVYLGDVVEMWFQLCSVCLEEYLPKIATSSSLQPVFYAANFGSPDTTVPTWIMLKYARPWNKSTNVIMMLLQRSRNTWRRWLRTLLSYWW